MQPGRVGGPYTGVNAQIRVINSIQTVPPEALQWVYSDSKDTILAVDYSQCFVVIVFNGYRGGITTIMQIKRIWQVNNNVFVLAHFNDPPPPGVTLTVLPATSSQYQVVKISRTQLTQSGAITFSLLDETGYERATIEDIITK